MRTRSPTFNNLEEYSTQLNVFTLVGFYGTYRELVRNILQEPIIPSIISLLTCIQLTQLRLSFQKRKP